MSRIGKKEINIPENVLINVEPNKVIIKGTFGILEQKILKGIQINIEKNKIFIIRENDSKKTKAFHGLFQVLIKNMILGVSNKFEKILLIEGVGYKFQIKENTLVLNIGYSHTVNFEIPKNLDIIVELPTKLLISGIDKEKVGLFASQIRSIRPPEPYKGKGIKYQNEIIIKKIGKNK